MSKKQRNRPLYPEGVSSAPVTAQPPAQKETVMEAPQQQETEPTEPKQEAQSGLTAKQMAAMEEMNQLRALQIAARNSEPPPPPTPNVTDVISQGYDALNEAWQNARKHQETKEYTPPPRTARQMSALEEELEAGRRAVERAQKQQAEAAEQRAQASLQESANEGFTTPVYRPGDAVPDPMNMSSGGALKYGTHKADT